MYSCKSADGQQGERGCRHQAGAGGRGCRHQAGAGGAAPKTEHAMQLAGVRPAPAALRAWQLGGDDIGCVG